MNIPRFLFSGFHLMHRFGIHNRKMGKKDLAKTAPKRKKTRKREAIKRSAASHLELQRKGAAKKKRENREWIYRDSCFLVSIFLRSFNSPMFLLVCCPMELRWIKVENSPENLNCFITIAEMLLIFDNIVFSPGRRRLKKRSEKTEIARRKRKHRKRKWEGASVREDSICYFS